MNHHKTCIKYVIFSIALGTGAANAASDAQAPVRVFAASSLTGAMTAVAKLYSQQTGQQIETVFGPAGLLLDRIENREPADILVSANMEHPQKLADDGFATQPVVLVRNRLCATALPNSNLTTENLLDRLMDPRVRLGTSTPKADPGGDYVWMMFAKAEKVRHGAQAVLEKKAQQLVGGTNNPPVPQAKDAVKYFFAQKKVDIFLGYCSSRQTTPDPELTSVELPEALSITADYGLSVVTREPKSHVAAYRFALFLLSPQAQKIMSQYKFTAVAISSAK